MPNWELIEEFIQASRTGNIQRLQSMFDAHPLLLNAVDRKRFNALMAAADKTTFDWLLEQGAVSPPVAIATAEAEFRGFVAAGNLPRAREHADFYQPNLELVQNHHQCTNVTILHEALRTPEMVDFVLELGAGKFLESRLGPGEEGRAAGWTPLQRAVQHGWTDSARALLDYGATYDPFSAAGLDDCHRLLEFRPVELRVLDHYGSTPLHWAAKYASFETVLFLLEHGPAIDTENAFGETPLIFAGLASSYYAPSHAPRTDIIQLFRDHGAHEDVHAWAAIGDVVSLQTSLKADSSGVNATNRFKSTPLHFAAWAGHAEATQILLNHGADPNAVDLHGMPPFLYAAYWGRHESTVELLLENGADIYWENIWGKGINSYDAIHDLNHWLARKGGQAVHDAALAGNLDQLRSILNEDPKQVHALSKSGATPLHFAASGNQVVAIKLLLERNADLEARMDRGLSPLYSAARAGAADAVTALLAAGADVMAKGMAWEAWTPLHAPTKNRGDRVKVTELLLAAGADPNGGEHGGGFPPLYATVIQADLEKARVLIDHGANVNHKIPLWDRDSLLHTAARRPEIPEAGAVAMIELLIEHGADLTATDNADRTPLEVACNDTVASALYSQR